MNKRQMGAYSMGRTVEKHFDDDRALWEKFAPVAESKEELTRMLTVISVLLAAQLVNLTGITELKDDLRSSLELQAFVLSAALCSYATMAGEKDLYKNALQSKSDLKRYSGDALVGVCTYLLATGRNQLANLDRYGVSTKSLETFSQTMASFVDIMKKPKESIGHRSTTTKNIDVAIAKLMDFFTKQMDKVVVMLIATEPDFVATYENLRVIHETGTRHLALTITTLDARTNEGIARVNLEIVGKNIHRISSERGFNTVQNLVGGAYEIKAWQENYVTKIEHFTIVPGETTELIVLMERK
ncbi:hypothetical protein [Flavobacterium sp. SM2513]|uniref:hypothetical protein n=1 Tax=Flavobacterium sp. SM2513 TaxID=3424766 RepID=UPI003D7FCC36